tara:strand:- start:39 stop:1427 length:1389 start_codon:yes stop_codon:yes gene_type:complete
MSDNLLMLLEMIEEVLEEQKKPKYDEELKIKLANDYLDLIRSKGEPYDKAELKRGFSNPNSAFIQITNVGSDQQRENLTNDLGLEPYQYKKQLVYPRSSAKKKSGGKIPNQPFIIKFSQGSSRGARKLSERFEENLIYSLNSGQESASTKDRVKEEEHQGIQSIADQVANASGLEKDQGWFKPLDHEPSDKYKILANGKTRKPKGTPKTDISDEKQVYRISVKQDSAQLLSGQAEEVMSITSVVAEQLNYTEVFKRLLILKVEAMGDKVAIDALEPKGRGDLGRQIAEVLFKEDEFKEKFLLEAMTGNNRFTDSLPIANSLLIWDLAGRAHFEPEIEIWVSNNYSNVKYGVRSRGQGRGLAARLEPYVKEFAAKSGEDGFVNEIEMQINPAVQNIASLPPTPPIPEEIPTKVMVAAIEQFFAELEEDKFLSLLDAVGIDEEEYSCFDFTIRQNLSKANSEGT